jgi:spore germination protein KB
MNKESHPMLEKGKISDRQAKSLLVATILPTSIFSLPALTAAKANEDAWLSVIFASLIGVVVVLTIVALGQKFPEKTIVEYSEDIMGKLFGKTAGLIYIWFFLYLTALTVREFSEFMLTVFMDEMPIVILIGSILLVCALAIYHGLEVISRLNEILITLVIGFFLFALLLSTGEMAPFRLLPVFANGIIPILKGSFHVAGRMGEVVVLAFLIPYINQATSAKRTGLTSLLIVTPLFILSVIASILTFGAHGTGRLLFPTYMVARNIKFADILERIESIFMLIWVMGTFAKITICYYVTVLSTGHWLNLSKLHPLILPIGTIVAALSLLIHVGISEIIAFLDKIWGPYALSIELGIPLILLTIAIIRHKGVKKS